MQTLSRLYKKAKEILSKNKEVLIKRRLEKGMDLPMSSGGRELKLPKDLQIKRMSQKLFDISDVASPRISNLTTHSSQALFTSESGDLGKISDDEDVINEFVVLKDCFITDTNNKEIGQLRSGAKIECNINLKRKIGNKKENDENSGESWIIKIIKPVTGWVSLMKNGENI